jgi:methylase of polypeptide subunit release factors
MQTPDQPKNVKIVSEREKSVNYECLFDLLTNIKNSGYKFITVTPKTHSLFLSRHAGLANNLRDIFGWNLPFAIETLCPMVKGLMIEADLIILDAKPLRSKLRVASLGSDVFLHSAFPTDSYDAVFFGPDTYRFARFVRNYLEKQSVILSATCELNKPFRILDIGCGAGAGGIAAVRALPPGPAYELTMNDINVGALDLTVVNAEVAGIPIHLLEGDIFEVLTDEFDLIIANPPFIKDESGRAYRDGGAQLGLEFSIRIFKAAFEHLAPSGQLIIYTGVAMTSQSDPFLATIMPLLADANCTWSYEEIDPDIFGEELEMPDYANASRIAAVGLIVKLH